MLIVVIFFTINCVLSDGIVEIPLGIYIIMSFSITTPYLFWALLQIKTPLNTGIHYHVVTSHAAINFDVLSKTRMFIKHPKFKYGTNQSDLLL